MVILLDHGADIELAVRNPCDCTDDLIEPPKVGDWYPKASVPNCSGDLYDNHGTHFWTPLPLAIRHRHESTALFLLDRGASPCRMSGSGGHSTALHWASVTCLRSVINYLLDNKLEDVNVQAEHGVTPLHIAYAVHEDDFFDWYMDKANADILLSFVSSPNGNRWTVFAMACAEGELSIVQKLLERGADPDFVVSGYGTGHAQWTALALVHRQEVDIDYPVTTSQRREIEDLIIKVKVNKALQKMSQEAKVEVIGPVTTEDS